MAELRNVSTIIYAGEERLGEVYFVHQGQRWFVLPTGHTYALDVSFVDAEQGLRALVSYHQGLLRSRIERRQEEITVLRDEINRLEGAVLSIDQIVANLTQCI